MGLFSSKKTEEEQKKDQSEEQQAPDEKEKSYKEHIEEGVDFYHMPKDIKLGRPAKGSSQKEAASQEKKKQKEAKEEKRSDKIEAVSEEAQGADSDNKTKIVGVIIMVAGIIVMGGAIYLGYAYFVAPAMESETERQEEQKDQDREEESAKEEQEQESSEESTKEEEKEKEEKEKEEEKQKEATTTSEEATSTPEEATTTPEEATSTEPSFSDQDGDGLFDAEEELVGSGINNEDSDNDGYKDKTEILNLYNPARGEASPLLEDNSNIDKYINTEPRYEILYPSKWNKQVVQEGRNVFFRSGEGSYLSVIVEDNSQNRTIKNWYRDIKVDTTELESDSSLSVIEKNNWEAVSPEDKTIFYLTGEKREKVYILTLASQSGESHLKYKNIFRMALNSFRIQ